MSEKAWPRVSGNIRRVFAARYRPRASFDVGEVPEMAIFSQFASFQEAVVPNFYEIVPLSTNALLTRLAGQKLGTWCKFITLHNTSEPSLALWAQNRKKYSAKELVANMEDGWRDLGWHTGPHYIVTPETDMPIYELSDPSAPGVHASCFNARSIGIEMVGEYNLEDFNSGPGAGVRDNAIFLLAALHNKLGLTPLPYAYDQKGLHFHKECIRDQHDCPGKDVIKPDVIALIQAKMKSLPMPVAAAGRVTALKTGVAAKPKAPPKSKAPPKAVAKSKTPRKKTVKRAGRPAKKRAR